MTMTDLSNSEIDKLAADFAGILEAETLAIMLRGEVLPAIFPGAEKIGNQVVMASPSPEVKPGHHSNAAFDVEAWIWKDASTGQSGHGLTSFVMYITGARIIEAASLVYGHALKARADAMKAKRLADATEGEHHGAAYH